MTYRNLIIVTLCVTIISCSPSNKHDSKIIESNVVIAKQVFEHFNKHDWTKMADLYNDTAYFKDPSFGQMVVQQTRLQTIEKYKNLQGMSLDIRDDIVGIYPSGNNHVIVEFVSSGTAPDGTKWQLPICTIFTIESGKIIKDFTYYDNE